MTNDRRQGTLFTVSQTSTSLTVSFSATLQNIDRVAEEIKGFMSKMGLDTYPFDILLVMREALTNAVIEGSHLDAGKTVSFALRLEDQCLIMEVEDEGEGFDWRDRLGREPRPHFECGRGLAIMKEYCTDVTFNEKGNRLILRMETG